ncbi:cystatin domain protein [Oesophagostomum dentatum]|uniref:Cystatin domain protein n=1 Tax=Oesophagostomum dentatum TaxID=61180 RepID=A0A0B1SNW7_OESDE|nr:cystatin domain protein [Oesophagostomum dentatum]
MWHTFLVVIELFVLTFYTTHGQLPGGHTPQDPNDPEFMEKAWKATATLNEAASNAGPYLMVPIKVVKAETQVVAGINYFLEVLFGESTCKKGVSCLLFLLVLYVVDI